MAAEATPVMRQYHSIKQQVPGALLFFRLGDFYELFQEDAVIAAREKLVSGAVGMVEMALKQLSERHVVVLDDERKAAMVSNLLVVLCGETEAQPVVNTGTLYH